MLQRLYERSHAALAPHRRAVIALTVIALAFCFWRAARMTPDEDITSFLPDHDDTVDAFRLVVDRFHQQDQLFFDVGADDGAAAEADVTLAADVLDEKLEASGLFRAVRYRMTPEQGLAVLEWLDGAKPELFGADDRAALEALLTPAAVAERLGEARRRLLEPEGVLLKDMLRRDPLGLRSLFLAKLAALQGGADVRFAGGRIWSADGHHVLVVAEPSFPSSDTLESERLFAAIDGAVTAARTAARGTVQVRYAGGHRAARDNRALVREDLGLASALSVVAIAALVWLGFRRRILVLLSFTPVLFGFMSAVAVFSFFTDRAALVIFGSASIFAGLTIDYAIYTLFRFDNLPPGADPGRGLSSLASPLLLGAATTAAAFASLAVSVLPGQRTLGVFSAVGVMSAALFALLVLPHLLPRGGKVRARSVLPIAAWHGRLISWLRTHRRASAGAVALLTVVAALGLGRLRFDGDLRHLNGVRPETLRDEEALLTHWGGALAATAVVVRGRTAAEALAANERLAGTLTRMRDAGEVRSFASVASLVPSPAVAAANRARWREVFDDQRRAELARVMDDEGRRLGFAAGAFAPFWRDLEVTSATHDPLAAATGQGPLAVLLSPQLALGGAEAFVLTRVEIAPERLAAVSAGLRTQMPGVLVVNGGALAEHVTTLVSGGLAELALVSLSAVTLLVWLFLRRPGHVLAVLVPVAFDVVWTLGALGLLGVAVNLMNSLFIGLVFGVSSDYAIFLTGALRDGREEDIGVTGGAVTLCALTTLAGFGVLALARHPVLFAMGITSLVGVALGLVASLLVVPLWMPQTPARPRALEEAA